MCTVAGRTCWDLFGSRPPARLGEPMKTFTLALSMLMCGSLASARKPSGAESKACKAYFLVAEKDTEVTVNLTMVGLNRPQRKWYRKHGGRYANLCLVNGDASGNRVAFNSASQSYVELTPLWVMRPFI